MSEATERHRLAGSVEILDGPDELAGAAAARVVELTAQARRSRGRFNIALAGGATPVLLYRKLTEAPYRDSIDWPSWHVYFDDERAVPPDGAGSNYRMAKEALLDRVPIDAGHVYRMRGESSDLDAAADEYSSLLEHNLPRASNAAPQLDCVLLGLGENGHTASLFPDTRALEVTDRWAVPSRADYAPFDRITITFPIINAAETVIFLVTGEKKAQALLSVAAGTAPAARVRPTQGSLLWLLDRTAARGIA